MLIVQPKTINKFANIMVSALNLRQKPSPAYVAQVVSYGIYVSRWLLTQSIVVTVFAICILLLFGAVVIGFGGDLCKHNRRKRRNKKKPDSDCQCMQWHLVVDCIDRSWEINCYCDNMYIKCHQTWNDCCHNVANKIRNVYVVNSGVRVWILWLI